MFSRLIDVLCQKPFQIGSLIFHLLPLIALADFRTHRTLSQILADKSISIERKVSIAPDGFQTSFLEIFLRGTNPKKTALLVHGLNVDGNYWLDFVQASSLVEEGYRILLPDLMARGQTKELNFQLHDPNLREWQPNPAQSQWLKNLTPEQESFYLYHLLLNERKRGRKPNPLLIAGHSRGGIVTANLLYRMGLDNRTALGKSKSRVSLPWEIEAHWNFNGLVMYHSESINFALASDKSREKVLAAFDAALEMREGLNRLRDAEINVGDDREIQLDLEAQSRVKPILTSFQTLFDGPREAWLIDLLVNEFENSPEAQGFTRHANRALFVREEFLSTAQVQGLRTLYRVNTNDQGRESFSTKNIMLPDSVLGIYRSIQRGELPGIGAMYVIQGTRDVLVPTSHAKLLIPKEESLVPFFFKIYSNHEHYGPDDPEVRKHFQTQIKSKELSCFAMFH